VLKFFSQCSELFSRHELRLYVKTQLGELDPCHPFLWPLCIRPLLVSFCFKIDSNNNDPQALDKCSQFVRQASVIRSTSKLLVKIFDFFTQNDKEKALVQRLTLIGDCFEWAGTCLAKKIFLLHGVTMHLQLHWQSPSAVFERRH
jgi:hypothetical protein